MFPLRLAVSRATCPRLRAVPMASVAMQPGTLLARGEYRRPVHLSAQAAPALTWLKSTVKPTEYATRWCGAGHAALSSLPTMLFSRASQHVSAPQYVSVRRPVPLEVGLCSPQVRMLNEPAQRRASHGGEEGPVAHSRVTRPPSPNQDVPFLAADGSPHRVRTCVCGIGTASAHPTFLVRVLHAPLAHVPPDSAGFTGVPTASPSARSRFNGLHTP